MVMRLHISAFDGLSFAVFDIDHSSQTGNANQSTITNRNKHVHPIGLTLKNQLHPCQFDLRNTSTQWISNIKFIIYQQLTSIDRNQNLKPEDSHKN